MGVLLPHYRIFWSDVMVWIGWRSCPPLSRHQPNSLVFTMAGHLPRLVIPPATKLGGVLESPCLSVRPSICLSADAWLGKIVQSHNCLPFISIIMKLHTQTPHESRMCPIDIWVKDQGHNALKLDLYDKNNLQMKPVYSIWFVMLHSFWLLVFTCKEVWQ